MVIIITYLSYRAQYANIEISASPAEKLVNPTPNKTSDIPLLRATVIKLLSIITTTRDILILK